MYPRFFYIILTGIFFFIGIGIIIFSQELGIFRGWIGDILIIMFLFTLVQSIHVFQRWLTTLGILIFAFMIEGLQYIHIMDVMGWSGNMFTEVILGSTFDPLDLLFYIVGASLITIIDSFFMAKKL